MRRLSLTFALGSMLLAAAPAIAQQGTANVGGNVTDQGGGVLPGATLIITNEDTGAARDVTTTADGSYFASQMMPGRYRVTAKMPSFKSLERRGIVLEVGRTLMLDLTLEVGGSPRR
jgi:hypothetical protein